MDKPRRTWASLDGAALILLVLETVGTLFVAVGYVVYALLDDEMTSLGAALAVVIAVMGAGLAVFTWGYARDKRFALGGVVTWQLMQLSVGVSVFPALPAVGIPLILSAIVVAWAAMRRLSAYRSATES
jgi:hypothetical protein